MTIARFAAVLFSGTLLSALAAAPVFAEGAMDRVREAGFLRVGFPNQVPYAYATVEGALTGAHTLGGLESHLGVGDMVGVLTEFAGLIQSPGPLSHLTMPTNRTV